MGGQQETETLSSTWKEFFKVKTVGNIPTVLFEQITYWILAILFNIVSRHPANECLFFGLFIDLFFLYCTHFRGITPRPTRTVTLKSAKTPGCFRGDHYFTRFPFKNVCWQKCMRQKVPLK